MKTGKAKSPPLVVVILSSFLALSHHVLILSRLDWLTALV